MKRIISMALLGAALLATGCGRAVPDDGEEVETYCYGCYKQIQNGQAFTPAGDGMPEDSEGGAARG